MGGLMLMGESRSAFEVQVDYDTPPGDPRWDYHDMRCMGECEKCWGADACGLVGHSCIPCTGCLPRVDGDLVPQSAMTWPG
jgi:hypothetical protein